MLIISMLIGFYQEIYFQDNQNKYIKFYNPWKTIFIFF